MSSENALGVRAVEVDPRAVRRDRERVADAAVGAVDLHAIGPGVAVDDVGAVAVAPRHEVVVAAGR